MEEYFRARGAFGVPIKPNFDILISLFADDQAIYADSYKDAENKLNILAAYARENSLEVNSKKTKILIVSKRKRKNRRLFLYLGEEIEQVSSFSYLGVTFSETAVYHKALKYAQAKAASAVGAALNICNRSKMRSWMARVRLNDATVVSTLLYGAEIWGLRYLEDIEKSYLSFYKRLFNLNKCTPYWLIRAEFKTVHSTFQIIKRSLNWLVHILSMENSRTTKCCYFKLKELHDILPSVKFNWFTQLFNLLNKFNCAKMLLQSDPYVLKKSIPIILNTYIEYQASKDFEALVGAKYNPLYREIASPELHNIYTNVKLPFSFVKLFCQLRLSGTHCIKLTYNSMSTIINPREMCPVCNLNEFETLFHIFLVCPIYKALRAHIIPGLGNVTEYDLLLNFWG